MTFDDHINQAFESLTERLRGEIDQEVQRRTDGILAAMPAPVPVVEPVRTDAPPSFDAESAARLHGAVRSIDAARSLTAILDALVTAARAEATTADVWLSRGGQLHHWRSPGSSESVQDAPSGSLVVPITLAGSDAAFLYADVRDAGTTNVEQRTMNVELLTRYAARSLEALTAFKTARALTQRPEPAAEPLPETADPGVGDEEASARRYARLLVSEIKLYHEAAVIDARRDRDLAARLGGEITRARVLYEERVPSHVRERADYFHDELVCILANGDASLLEVRS